MVYVPPKYPGAIPTLGDLPNRQDDVDWLVAARYNELKKELRAALTELGTLPKGAYADVKTRLDAGVAGFTDRSDPPDWDFLVGDFITDWTWRDLDLSGIVPDGAKAVLIRVNIQDDAVASVFQFRKNGHVSVYAGVGMHTQVANVTIAGFMVVACDNNRVVEYRGSNVAFIGISIIVMGWWF